MIWRDCTPVSGGGQEGKLAILCIWLTDLTGKVINGRNGRFGGPGVSLSCLEEDVRGSCRFLLSPPALLGLASRYSRCIALQDAPRSSGLARTNAPE